MVENIRPDPSPEVEVYYPTRSDEVLELMEEELRAAHAEIARLKEELNRLKQRFL